jgi:hypothetical protein
LIRRPARGVNGVIRNAWHDLGEAWLDLHEAYPMTAIVLTVVGCSAPCLAIFWMMVKPDIYIMKDAEPALIRPPVAFRGLPDGPVRRGREAIDEVD